MNLDYSPINICRYFGIPDDFDTSASNQRDTKFAPFTIDAVTRYINS